MVGLSCACTLDAPMESSHVDPSEFESYSWIVPDVGNFSVNGSQGSPPEFLDPNMQAEVPLPSKNLIKLNCNARGLPMPNITWMKDGDPNWKEEIIRAERVSCKPHLVYFKSCIFTREDENLSLQ